MSFLAKRGKVKEKKTFSSLLIFYVVSVIVASVNCAYADTMRETMEYALENNPSVNGAKAAREAMRYEGNVERSHFFPEISAGLTAGRVYQNNATSRGLSVTRGAAYSGYGEGSVAVRQMLYDGNQTSNRLDSAQALESEKYYGMVSEQGQIAQDAMRSYVEILKLRSGMQLLAGQSRTLAEYQDRITKMTDTGMGDEAELQQARDVSMVIESLAADYEGRLISAEAAYVEAVGKPAPREMDVPESVQVYVEKDLDEVISRAKTVHPLVRAAGMHAQAAEASLRAEQGRLYPDLTGEVSHYKVDKKDVIGGELVDSRAVVKMNWSFSTGGREISSVDRKRAEYLEALNKKEEVQRNVERGIRDAYARYLTYWKKRDLSQKRIDLNRKLIKTYESQFEGSRISLLSLMRAQSQLFKAELDYNDNSFSLLSAQYSVLAARGELLNVVFASAPGDLNDETQVDEAR